MHVHGQQWEHHTVLFLSTTVKAPGSVVAVDKECTAAAMPVLVPAPAASLEGDRMCLLMELDW